jgi:hypothetical protein
MNEILVRVHELLTQAIALLTSVGGNTADDPMTAVLDQRGVWRPSWLLALNAQALAYRRESTQPGPGGVARRVGLHLIDGFIFNPCLQRTDLTERQRATITAAHNATFLAAMTGDPAQAFLHLPLDEVPAPEVDATYVAQVHSSINDPQDLRRRVERHYRINGLVP